ncbi:2-oxo-4-hydroxy-4-carboxy-5-ureidoimidazoline decarboxylase [Amycolatopsis acidiphila]|uniref:2-oxo-4-hydroxy-4-carboxy-5-ureidoimidazoline decarboxylase n=1 Tax=Amycolatopsis acidiphila TaxID=715473 RepID=UPI0019B07B94|nr:2-oxo-4-hydroxy-4-carboxy-5-ureidoimidazoline decarboxylase [Amycolatopsis acidiphila]UIJ61572.1 2-oxo-4-hydroxy-4-carboxy-5-ureidoimidazoline decarboxylase [Amycolatopsis acidiphila]GHG59148.1 OHCU decarboxylase [Amycolatopsis acidiphila]
MSLDLAGFNTAPSSQLQPLLTECLDVPRWTAQVLSGRPYADFAAVQARAEIVLEPREIRRAMAAHPRIGEKATGASKTEQSGVDSSAVEKFRAANAEYEQRFGHVFLVCASGRSGAELLANLRERMANDPDAELAVAGRELVEIALLRLGKLVIA